MAYVKLAICALSAVILLSLGSAKSELLNKSQIQPSGEERASPFTGLATFQSKRPEKMSLTLGQLGQCKNYGESCTYDSECCSNSCNEVGGYNKCGGTH
jgi:hypothetical protein